MNPWTIAGALVIAFAAWILFSGFLKTWRLYHGVHLITCPDNLQTAAVGVAAFDAARRFAISGENELRLNHCSRWPEKAGCAQDCLSQIEASPASCRVQSVVTSWYEGKSCNYCGRVIGPIVWHERPPAVRMPDGTIRTWKEIAPQDLPKVFVGGEPVCWACCTVETFIDQHPDMVIQRVRLAVPEHAIPPSQTIY